MKFEINSGSFPVTICVIICSKKKAVKKANKIQRRKGDDKITIDRLSDLDGLFITHKSWPCIIWLPKAPETPKEISTASHELLHATFDTLAHVGVEYNDGSEETFTYLFGHYMEQFLNNCNK